MNYIKSIIIILLITTSNFCIYSQNPGLTDITENENKIKELINSREEIQKEIKQIEEELLEVRGDSVKILELEKLLIRKKTALNEIDFLTEKLQELENERAERKRISKINWLLIILSSLILILSVIIVLYLREKILQKTIKQELYTIKQLALSRQLNPHFMHNSLGAIQNYIFKENKIEANKYITLLSDLFRKIFDSSQKETIKIKEEIEMLEEYLKIELMRFDNKFTYSIKADEEIIDNEIPPSLLQPIVENSIWHGLMHLEGKGEVKIELQKINVNQISCTIEDNGIGREKSGQINKSKQIQKVSRGIELTKKRLNLLNRVGYKKSSIFKIIDLKGEAGEAMGTRTEIIIPLI